MNEPVLLILYQFKSLAARLKYVFGILVFLSVSIAVFVFLMLQTKTIFPKILVCNEDKSFESGLLIGTVMNERIRAVVEIEAVDYQEGRDLLEQKKAVAMLHIKPSTIETLYEGEKISIDLYVNNRDGMFKRMLIDYFQALTKVINMAQNSGLLYMDSLYSRGFDYSVRMEKFKDMQKNYLETTVLRDRIFNIQDNFDLFHFFPIKTYYYSFVILVVLALDGLIKSNSLFSRPDIRKRLKVSGYSEVKIGIAEHIFILILTLGTAVLLDNLSCVLGGHKGFNIFIKNFPVLLFLVFFIRFLGIIINIFCKSGLGLIITTAIVYTGFILTSGILFPSYVLGEWFVKWNVYNPLAIVHHVLVVNRMI